MPPRDRSFYPLPNAYARHLLDRLAERRQTIGAFRAKANRHRTPAEYLADVLTQRMGSVPFVIFHVVLFTFWFVVNSRLLTFVPVYDPFPFGLLTMVLTLEQSFLTIFIIISQNRAAEIAELRNEIDLQINVLAEEEISKALKVLRLIGEKLDIEEVINDAELRVMETTLDHVEMEKEMLQELGAKVDRIATASNWTDPRS